jgi:DNA-binding transcriptional MerR regulator
MHWTIGELAKRTGVTVKAIRFYSDRGLVPPTDRTPAGYRLYGPEAVARLGLVRTLRELGLDIETIRRVLHEDADLTEVAATHAEALAVQIRILQERLVALKAIARRGIQGTDIVMNEHRLIAEFLDGVFEGQSMPGIRRSMTPELPAQPSAEQVEAWVELAELTRDVDFRQGLHNAVGRMEFTALATYDVLHIDPRSPEAEAIVQSVEADREELLAWVKTASDPRRDKYMSLLATINGWAPPPKVAPVFEWFAQALVGSLN